MRLNHMIKKLHLATLFILVLSLLAAPSALARESGEGGSLFPLEIRNMTGQPINLVLVRSDGTRTYSLNVAANTDQRFTLEGGTYRQFSYACGKSASGSLAMTAQVRLIFTPCAGLAPNSGAPTMEKVHLTDAPTGKKWHYQYGPAGAAASSGTFVSGLSGPCEFTASVAVTIYERPSTTADVFSTQPAGFGTTFQARTANGWLGFDPGVAQAANIGPFRLRWIPPNAKTVSGACSSLPVVWGPPPGICFDMPMSDTSVYTDPNTGSAVLVVLHLGDFAKVLGLNSGGDWAKVDLGPGNTGSSAVGWVNAATLNMNGPCSSLPTVSP
jgi:hypothetical protein